MVAIKKPPGATEKKCWECEFYKICIPGGAFCEHYKKFFPNQRDWAIKGKTGTKPGMRSCKFWKLKVVNLY
jgi:hypothetical protein